MINFTQHYFSKKKKKNIATQSKGLKPQTISNILNFVAAYSPEVYKCEKKFSYLN